MGADNPCKALTRCLAQHKGLVPPSATPPLSCEAGTTMIPALQVKKLRA